jgi:hypothetical protein
VITTSLLSLHWCWQCNRAYCGGSGASGGSPGIAHKYNIYLFSFLEIL